MLGSGEARLENLVVLDSSRREAEIYQHGEPLTVAFDVELAPQYQRFHVSVGFLAEGANVAAQCHSAFNEMTLENPGRPIRVAVTIPELLLNPGNYAIGIVVFDETCTRHLCWHYAAKTFRVEGDRCGIAPVQWRGAWRLERAV